MNTQMYVLVGVVGGAILLMLGINLYLMFASRRKDPDGNYLVLHQRFDALAQLLSGQLQQSRESTERATLSVHQQVQNFTQGMTQLQETVKQVQDSVRNVASFQDVFKSPKLRGIWGEASLEASLNQFFPRERYAIQHYFKSGEAVDAVLKLPNDLVLPVDSKFNWENFEKMVNSQTDMNRDIYRKQFFSDVKKKIDEIAGKYILPSEGTTDLALMYIPAETVYYEVINNIKEVDIPAYARSKKVYLVSPNTFALSVSAISHWFRDVEVHSRTQDIIKRFERIAQDGIKLADGFKRLGKHISDAQSSYQDNEKRLDLMVGRVRTVITSSDADAKELDIPKA